MWIEIHMVNSKEIIIGNLYRPSQGDSNICCEYLTDIVSDIVQGNNADLFLLGDFNVNQFDKMSVEYKELHKFEILTNLTGADPGGGPGGPINFIKREKNVARVRAKTPHFST